jgi:peptide-methionine (S)-S-oxide reductase
MDDKPLLLGGIVIAFLVVAAILALMGRADVEGVEPDGKDAGPTPTQLNVSGEVATLGGGCFWCIEAVFAEIRGVEDVKPGYSGGSAKDATYRRVCTGKTGHAEVVQIVFDPEIITYREILEIFFHVHDPTTPNRQGADVGTQYRSVIFYHNEDQRATAEEVISEVESSGVWGGPLVTELSPFEAFYQAEDYHDDYYENHRNQPYCRVVIDPKLSKLRKDFEDKLKD